MQLPKRGSTEGQVMQAQSWEGEVAWGEDDCNKTDEGRLGGYWHWEHRQVEKCALILSAALTSWQSI